MYAFSMTSGFLWKLTWQHCIAGNFRRKNFHEFRGSEPIRESFLRKHLMPLSSMNPQKFSPQNLHTLCFAKVFSLESSVLLS